MKSVEEEAEPELNVLSIHDDNTFWAYTGFSASIALWWFSTVRQADAFRMV